MKRRAFALLAVLHVVTGASVVVMALLLAMQDQLRATGNRMVATRLRWRLDGCAEEWRASLDSLLAGGVSWELAGRHVSRDLSLDCESTATPAGYTLNVNSATPSRIRRLLIASGLPLAVADSLVDAIVDWRDADDIPRALGAEQDWYRRQRRVEPRNGAFAAAGELRLVRGLENTSVDTLLGVEDGRSPINLAPLPVLASLPGATTEMIGLIASRRNRGDRIERLTDLTGVISRAAGDSLHHHLDGLLSQATIAPDAWIVTFTASEGEPPLAVQLELRLVAAGPRAALVRRRVF